MKNTIFVLMFSCSLLVSAAQTAASPVMFSESSHSFGYIKEESGSVRHIFYFTNKGTSPVVIESVRTNCGCIAPEYSQKPVMPGATGSITVVFDPSGRPGAFFRDVAIVSGQGRNVDHVQVSGTVLPVDEKNKVPVTENYPIDLGAGVYMNVPTLYFNFIGQGTQKTVNAELSNTSKKAVTLYASVAEGGIFSISAPSSIPASGKVQVAVTCSLEGSKIWGEFRGEVAFIVNGAAGSSLLKLYGVGTDNFQQGAKAPQCTIDKPFYTFGNVSAGTTKKTALTMSNSGDAPLVVRAVKCGAGTECSLAPGTVVSMGKSSLFDVGMAFSTAPGVQAQSIWIVVNDPKKPMLEIRLSGTVARSRL